MAPVNKPFPSIADWLHGQDSIVGSLLDRVNQRQFPGGHGGHLVSRQGASLNRLTFENSVLFQDHHLPLHGAQIRFQGADRGLLGFQTAPQLHQPSQSALLIWGCSVGGWQPPQKREQFPIELGGGGAGFGGRRIRKHNRIHPQAGEGRVAIVQISPHADGFGGRIALSAAARIELRNPQHKGQQGRIVITGQQA